MQHNNNYGGLDQKLARPNDDGDDVVVVVVMANGVAIVVVSRFTAQS